MRAEIQSFLQNAANNLAKYCYIVWDYIKMPELTEIQRSDNSIICRYDMHMFLGGEPDKKLLLGNRRRGTISLSFEKTWLELVQETFVNCSPITEPADGWYNEFVCMKLTKENFRNPIEEFKSLLLTEKHLEYLSLKRQIYKSMGPATGVIKENKLIACAFAPHILNEKGFSFGIIRDVWTAPEWRKKGLGTDTTAHLCKLLFEANIKEIYLWVEKKNIPAITVYKKLGFETEDEILGTHGEFAQDPH